MQRFLVLFFIIINCWPAKAQQRVTDSLARILAQPGLQTEQKVKILTRLSNIYAARDPAKGLAYSRNALEAARAAGSNALVSYAYAYLANAYFRADSMNLTVKATDSALWYAGKTTDKLAKGVAWYRQGWLQNLNNQVDDAVASWQKALDNLEGLKEGAMYSAAIYYLYFGIYAERGDLSREQGYARMALREAQASGGDGHSLLPPVWQINGTAYLDRFEEHKDSVLLDSALYAFKKSIEAHRLYADEQPGTSTVALSALFTAQVYMDHFPPWDKDSVVRYVNLALANTDTVNNKTMLINCFTILSKYDLMDGRIARAENLLLRARALFLDMDPPDYYVGENLYLELSGLAEKKGDKEQALAYYKQYITYYKKEFDARQFETIRKMEARYQNEKKEKEILLLKSQEAFHKRQNYFYLSIAVIALLGLVFMFSAYHFRLRYSLQREKLLKQEKEEAHLQSKLKEEESARLRLEKHEAELQSMLKAEEAARLEAEQRLLKAQQEQLHKELLAGTLQIEHKNELLQNLKEKLLEQPSDSLHIRRVERILNDELRVDEDFEKVKSEFKDVHPEFFSRVQQHAQSKLTSLDLKYCAYMYMQLSSKQIASLLHVEPKSVRMAKYRIKQKLGLAKEEVLEEWLRGNFTS